MRRQLQAVIATIVLLGTVVGPTQAADPPKGGKDAGQTPRRS
jgi:hypothetical protein